MARALVGLLERWFCRSCWRWQPEDERLTHRCWEEEPE